MDDLQHTSGRTIGALVLIAIGALFLVGQLFEFNIWQSFDRAWQLFIIVPGLALLFFGVFGDKKAAGLAVPGMIVTGTGLILWFQESFDYYESWAYMWALYPVFTGAGLLIMGNRTGSEKVCQNGKRSLISGLTMFAIFAALFELVFFSDNGRGDFGRFILPAVLIVAGYVMLFGRSKPSPAPAGKPKNEEKLKHGGEPLKVVPPPDDPSRLINRELRRQIDTELGRDDPNGVV